MLFFIRRMLFFLAFSRSMVNENFGGDGQLHGVDVVVLMILMRFGGKSADGSRVVLALVGG